MIQNVDMRLLFACLLVSVAISDQIPEDVSRIQVGLKPHISFRGNTNSLDRSYLLQQQKMLLLFVFK